MTYAPPIEPILRSRLSRLSETLAGHRGVAVSTLGRAVYGDAKFFVRVADTSTTITARAYDRVTACLSRDWPADLVWPSDIPRPAPAPADPANTSAA